MGCWFSIQLVDVKQDADQLTGLRGLAALWVLLFHFQAFFAVDIHPAVNWVFQLGGAGVFIFFTLSGALLTRGFMRSERNISAYLVRRLFRVFPAYYFQLFVLCLAGVFFGFTGVPQSFMQWFEHLTMTFGLPPRFSDAIFGVWWTLPIELGFYLLLPLLSIFFTKPRIFWLLIIGLASMLLSRWLTVNAWADSGLPLFMRIYTLAGALDTFVLGSVATFLCIANPHWVARRKVLLSSVAWILVITALTLYHRHGLRYWSGHWIIYLFTPLFCSGVGILAGMALAGQDVLKFSLGNRAMVFLGEISFSLYLWHLVPILILVKMGYSESNLLAFVFVLLASLGLAFLSHRMIETPGITLGKRISRRISEQPNTLSSL